MRQYGGRPVWLHLPPGYDASRPAPYPLLLLHDGQNLSASRPEAWGGSWRVDETVDRLVAAGTMPPIVVAGVDHANADRIREMSPPQMLPWFGGPARQYEEAILDRIIPGLSNDLNVRPDTAGLGLGGSSMGGLATLWLAARHPGRFDRLIVMSPSVWVRHRAILRLLRSKPIDSGARIWLSAGRHEGETVITDARAVRDRLQSGGARDLHYVEDADGHHAEESWGRQFAHALSWLYR